MTGSPKESGHDLAIPHRSGGGTFLWFDAERGIYGVFMIRGSATVNDVALPIYAVMLQSISSALDSDQCGYQSALRGRHR